MVYKLGWSEEKGWRKLRGLRRLVDVINGLKCIDGIDQETVERQMERGLIIFPYSTFDYNSEKLFSILSHRLP